MGGGQFGLVLASMFPLSETYIVDISDDKLLEKYKPLSRQIPFKAFSSDKTLFDVIFMNDVFEHLSNPVSVLSSLRHKLSGPDSRIFIDTPCQFWIYPVTRSIHRPLYDKVLRGTVDYDHQQIWTKKSFEEAVSRAGFRIQRYSRLSEFTQPPSFYLDHMKITNPIVRLAGSLFYSAAPYVARNKIMSVLSLSPSG